MTIFNALAALIGLSTVMLAASLIVMCLVRILQYLANMRGKTLGEMLGALNRGFRTRGGDMTAIDDAPQLAFVSDVLTYPTLHASTTLVATTVKHLPVAELARRREQAAVKVEYLSKKDLLQIVRSMLEKDTSSIPNLLPARWSEQLPPEARTFRAFEAYVNEWYETLEGSATEQFKLTARRMTASLSCVVVVLFNIDGLQLATTIFNNPDLQAQLASQAGPLLETAERTGATRSVESQTSDREQVTSGVEMTFTQANGVLNEPALMLGWHGNPLVKAWCSGTEPRPSTPTLTNIRWLAGLVLSCVLLSLGAPFWADTLKRLLNLQNTLKTAALRRAEGDRSPKT